MNYNTIEFIFEGDFVFLSIVRNTLLANEEITMKYTVFRVIECDYVRIIVVLKKLLIHFEQVLVRTKNYVESPTNEVFSFNRGLNTSL